MGTLNLNLDQTQLKRVAAIVKALIERHNPAKFFACPGGDHSSVDQSYTLAVDQGLVTRDGVVTVMGKLFYTSYRLDLLLDTKWYNWKNF